MILAEEINYCDNCHICIYMRAHMCVGVYAHFKEFVSVFDEKQKNYLLLFMLRYLRLQFESVIFQGFKCLLQIMLQVSTMMRNANSLIPARFLVLLAHLSISIVILWSRVSEKSSFLNRLVACITLSAETSGSFDKFLLTL